MWTKFLWFLNVVFCASRTLSDVRTLTVVVPSSSVALTSVSALFAVVLGMFCNPFEYFPFSE